MTDLSKPKLQLRSGLSVSGDKTPSPATKLLISHGKPNFTIQRSPKTNDGRVHAATPSPVNAYYPQNNSQEFVDKNTTLNGTLKSLSISTESKQMLVQNGNTTAKGATENEANNVVLRRANIVRTENRAEKDDENIPEFIRRQRRIQERLANQNILDFEKRRSGYFTQVLISPSSPNRQSFAETMASPAVKPGLEMPTSTIQYEGLKEEVTPKEQELEQQQQRKAEESKENILIDTTISLNGQVEEEEVAKAIEEVNKAVEGEDDDKIEMEENSKNFRDNVQYTEPAVATVITLDHSETLKPVNDEKEQEETSAVKKAYVGEVSNKPPLRTSTAGVTQENGYFETVMSSEQGKANLVIEENPQYGHSNAETADNSITISHTNGLNESLDPKSEKIVNFEPKTVVSFSQELGNGNNKYPDTIRVVKEVEAPEVDEELKELTKLKFEIKADNQDIEVTPVLLTETA